MLHLPAVPDSHELAALWASLEESGHRRTEGLRDTPKRRHGGTGHAALDLREEALADTSFGGHGAKRAAPRFSDDPDPGPQVLVVIPLAARHVRDSKTPRAVGP